VMVTFTSNLTPSASVLDEAEGVLILSVSI
jgi:hypothetical protein